MGKLYEGPLMEELSGAATPTVTAVTVWRERQASCGPAEEKVKEKKEGHDDGDGDDVVAVKVEWDAVNGLSDLQRKTLAKLSSRGVYWKHPSEALSSLFYLFHGGDVDADGNCLFSSAQRALRLGGRGGGARGDAAAAQDLRRRAVQRFMETYDCGASEAEKSSVDRAVKNLYWPDLQAGWGVHFLQELKLLAPKADRPALDALIADLVQVGMQREVAAESIYKERCIHVSDGPSWAKYMSVSGSSSDEYDIVTLQYTQDGLLNVDENRDGRAAAFGDDIAIESLATEFKREIFVVQSHGFDGMTGEEDSLFFLPHRPRGEISFYPIFLFMKGTGWCGAGADHYEPLIAYAGPVISQDKAAYVL